MRRAAFRGARAAAVLVAAVLSILSAAGAPAGAQTVRGTLVDHPAGVPLPRASVSLLDSAGMAVDSTRSAEDGAFTLRARSAGHYLLFFTHPGYASVPSGPIRLDAGRTVEHRFEVPLISGVAIRRMSEVIDVEKRLQTDLTELCGEELRVTEAGMLVGVVRRRPDGAALRGAIVRVESAAGRSAPFHRATVTSANGVYVICNVPAGTVAARTELAGYRVDEGPLVVRAGEIGWYDVYLRRR